MAGKKRGRDLAAEAAAVAPPKKKAFGPEAMGVVVAALRRGATVKAAAREAGFSDGAVHQWRRKAPHFGAACRDALDGREALVVPGNGGREWQLRKARRNDFSRRRKRIYLEHFAATGDARAAAAAAGVSKGTVSNHKLSDPAFHEGCAQALVEAYATLEALAVGWRRWRGSRSIPARRRRRAGSTRTPSSPGRWSCCASIRGAFARGLGMGTVTFPPGGDEGTVTFPHGNDQGTVTFPHDNDYIGEDLRKSDCPLDLRKGDCPQGFRKSDCPPRPPGVYGAP